MSLISLGVFCAALVLIPWRLQRIRLGNYYGHMCGAVVFGLAGIRPQIQDKTGLPGGPMPQKKRLETMGPVLVVCNHTSTVDMWIGMWLNPVGGCGVAKREILRIPFFGFIYWLTGHLLIDRSNRQKSIESMNEVGQLFATMGWAFGWARGSRSRNGEQSFKVRSYGHCHWFTGVANSQS